jgi:HEPN domain-containing protein
LRNAPTCVEVSAQGLVAQLGERSVRIGEVDGLGGPAWAAPFPPVRVHHSADTKNEALLVNPKKTLHQDYGERAGFRFEALELLFRRGAYADVMREAQEIVELLLKGLLRKHRHDPPKWHDVSKILLAEEATLPESVRNELGRICSLSQKLRRERETSFYGDEDFLPSEGYGKAEAHAALEETRWLLELLGPLLSQLLAD